MSDREKIVITGLGIIGSAGYSIEEHWKNICEGKNLIRKDNRLHELDVDFCCPVQNFEPEKYINKSLIWRIDRFIQFALYASIQAVEDAKLNLATLDKRRIGIVLGNSLAGIATLEKAQNRLNSDGPKSASASLIPGYMGSMAVGQIAIQLGITGPSLLIGTACASGADAIGIAKKMLENDECDIVLAGASEAPITSLIVSSFTKLGALSKNRDFSLTSRPFDQERDGFVISEGAGVMILERESHALQRNAGVYATVSGYGTSNDAFHVTSPQSDGAGLKEAMLQALKDAKASPDDIGCINAHGTSTPLNDRTESAAIFDIFGKKPIVTSTKGVTGHSLAASGAIEAIYSVFTLIYNKIPRVAGLINIDKDIQIFIATSEINDVHLNSVLSNSLGFGGQNSSLIFSQYKTASPSIGIKKT